MKSYSSISVYLREKRREEKRNIFFSLSTRSLLRLFVFFVFIPFFFIHIIIIIWIYDAYCLIRVHFCSKTIYLFLVQFILNELSSSHFLTSEIFVKISSLKSLTAYHPENRKRKPLVHICDPTVTWIVHLLRMGSYIFKLVHETYDTY